MAWTRFNKFTGGDASDAIANSDAGEATTLQFEHVPTDHYVAFKAILTSYSENYDSTWASEDVFGRNDPLVMFQGTKRNISLGWTVVANSELEAKLNLSRCSELSQMLYPVYERTEIPGTNVIAAAPLFKVKFANLIADATTGGGLSCHLGGLSFEPDLEAGWYVVDGMLFPKLISLSCELTILHSHPLGFNRANKKGGHTFRSRTGGVEGKFPYGVDKYSNVTDREDPDEAKNLSAAEKDSKSSTERPGDATGASAKKDVATMAVAKNKKQMLNSGKGTSSPSRLDHTQYPPEGTA